MLKKLLLPVFVLFLMNSLYAQNKVWTKVNNIAIKGNEDNIIRYGSEINNATYFQLNKLELSTSLNSAPYRTSSNTSRITITVPSHNGTFENFEMFRVNTVAPELARRFTDIQSYVGRSTNKNEASTIRVTLTPQGFYGMIKKPGIGQVFINPHDRSGEYYMVFSKSDAIGKVGYSCEVKTGNNTLEDLSDIMLDPSLMRQVNDSSLRTYDIAISATGEYSQFHINQAGLGGASEAQQKAAVLAAMTVTIDRVNTIYERDLGVTLQIVANNDEIIFLNPSSDPFTNSNIFGLTEENQPVIDDLIGSANYDIGHIFCTAGGGFAPGPVCSNGNKAKAATGLPNPVGESFDVDFAAHEIGHQFGADHTFNNACGGARFSSTAMETGSGNTIMGYAGICPPNVQNSSDANFHQISIIQIFNFIRSGSGSTCGLVDSQSNTAPTLSSLPNSYTIPNGTAFYLDVEATDAEGDPLTYSWEQVDNEISTQPPLATAPDGPNFKSFPPNSSSRRYFPNFNEVLNNNLDPVWEVIPVVGRSMEFAITVRDNNIVVGQSSRDFVDIDFADVGPFQVTSQNSSDINWLPGETETITWDVAGTTDNGINTNNVNILLSTDGGITFDTTLALNTPNDGSEDIIVPVIQGQICRIMVEAVDNVFFALNSNSFAIDSNVTTTCNSYSNDNVTAIPDGNGTTSPDQGSAAFSTINIADDIQNISDINIHLNATHDGVSEILFQLQGPGEFTNLWLGNCSGPGTIDVTFNDNGSGLPAGGSTCGDPITGLYSPASTTTSIAEIFSGGTQGSFSLVAVDFFTGNTGTINSWEIEICSTTFSVEDNQINNFSITPNPNNGLFNITFGQPLSPDSAISLYDIRGRLIEKVDFNPNSLSQTIQLKNQYQPGIYLIEVSTSTGKFSKKLIIR